MPPNGELVVQLEKIANISTRLVFRHILPQNHCQNSSFFFPSYDPKAESHRFNELIMTFDILVFSSNRESNKLLPWVHSYLEPCRDGNGDSLFPCHCHRESCRWLENEKISISQQECFFLPAHATTYKHLIDSTRFTEPVAGPKFCCLLSRTMPVQEMHWD